MLGKASSKSSSSSSQSNFAKPTGVAETLVVNRKSQRVAHEILALILSETITDSEWKDQTLPTQYAILTSSKVELQYKLCSTTLQIVELP